MYMFLMMILPLIPIIILGKNIISTRTILSISSAALNVNNISLFILLFYLKYLTEQLRY